MADRRSALDDERVLALTRHFVCAADEVWRLQRGSEPDCLAFQSLVTGGGRITDRGTRQGYWVIAPGAGVLARVNTRNADRVLAALEEGLEAWDTLDAADRKLAKGTDLTSGHRWEDNFPEDGLALRRHVREVGPKGLAGERSPRWNVDTAWFTRDEVAAWIPANTTVGMRLSWSEAARRLARFHLVDNARGQTLPYAIPEVDRAELEATVTAVDDTRITLELRGHTEATSTDSWRLPDDSIWKPRRVVPHGIHANLRGHAVLDRASGRFTSFELVALAARWGHTVNNGRWRDPAPGHLAFHFGIAPDTPRIAPTFLSAYDADWVVAPAVMPWRDSPSECGLEEGSD